MTELIVALDGPNPSELQGKLLYIVRWFKIGPQAMARPDWPNLITGGYGPSSIFLDLKLADTSATVREAVKRFASAGVAAVSVLTERAVTDAMEAARGSSTKIWRVVWLSDDDESDPQAKDWARQARRCVADGIVCPARYADVIRSEFAGDIIAVGVRNRIAEFDGHRTTANLAFDGEEVGRGPVEHRRIQQEPGQTLVR